MKDEFEISLDYIHSLYQERNERKLIKVKNKPLLQVSDTLNKTKKKIDCELGRIPLKKILRYKHLKEDIEPFQYSEEEKKELEKLEKVGKQFFKINIHLKLYELLSILPGSVSNPYLQNFFNFGNFNDDIPKIRIDPLKLIFMVWHKALRKGQYNSDNILIKEKLFEYKKKTKGTNKKYLFKSLKKETDFDPELLRIKSLYPKDKKRKEFYNKLADFIYQKSFVEKISPL